MNYNTVYVGMDVHKESFSLCAYTIEAEKACHYPKTEGDYKNVLKYLEFLRTIYGNDVDFVCGYEAGCLGYILYHQLMARNVECMDYNKQFGERLHCEFKKSHVKLLETFDKL